MKNVKSYRIHNCCLALALSALFALSACTDPETAHRQQFEKALALQARGESEAAIAILQSQLKAKPDDPQLLQKIGEIYQSIDDLTMAAFYLEQAALAAPEDSEGLYRAYLALKANGDDTFPALGKLATQAPDKMTPELWLELGARLAQAEQTQPALDAYLRGIPKNAANVAPETAATIGTLFLQLDNKALAERWFTRAAQGTGPEALTALLGLLEIKLAAADWPAAEAYIQKLDQSFPGAIDASDWATARSELQTWREAQKEMTETLQANTLASKPEVPSTGNDNKPATSSGKSIAAAEFDAMEALANKPAINDAPLIADPDIRFNPDITIQPADPSLIESPAVQPQPDPEPVSESPATLEIVADPVDIPVTLEQLLKQAENATLQRDFKSAIRIYWQALGRDNTDPLTWSRLSQSYTLSGETRNAETTALEAVRLAPANVEYTLDYLRVAQRSKSPRQFLAELETAYDRFPSNPEIILSLARAFQRISNDGPAAATLYRQFIELVPRHPLRPEAEAALATIEQPAL